MSKYKINSLFDLQRVKRDVTLEGILEISTTKSNIKVVTFNKLSKKYNVIFFGEANEVYSRAKDYLDIPIINVRAIESELIITI